jgi:ABC-type dipeptide/oligopeptide/nickel transport system permease component
LVGASPSRSQRSDHTSHHAGPIQPLMLPSPHTRPRALALRSVLLGGLVAVGLLLWHGCSWRDCVALLFGQLAFGPAGSMHLLDLVPLALRSLGLVLAAMIVAATLGLTIGRALARANLNFARLAGMIGRFIAATPIVGLAWLTIMAAVRYGGLPIESLLPYEPPVESDTQALRWGRNLWAWLLPMWVLVLPLLGQWLNETTGRLRDAWPLPHRLGLDARGVRTSSRAHQHWWPMAWVALIELWGSLGLLALGYAIVVETLFALPGWGSFMGQAVRSTDSYALASGIYVSGWMAAIWAILTHILRAITGERDHQGEPSFKVIRAAQTVWAEFRLYGVLFLVGGIGFCISVPLVTEPLVATLQWLPEPARSIAQKCWPNLHSDLQVLTTVLLLTLAITFLRGGMAWLSAGRSRWQAQMLETTEWAPLLVWAFAFTAPSMVHEPVWLTLGIIAGVTGARRFRDLGIQLRSLPHVDAAKLLGGPWLSRWMRHVAPLLFQWLSSWLLNVMGTSLLWLVCLQSLVEPDIAAQSTGLGYSISNASIDVLNRPQEVLWPTLLTAVITWSCWQAGRLLGR